MKLREEQMKAIMFQDDDPGFLYDFIEQTVWENHGKVDTCDIIFAYNGKYYMFPAYRSGTWYNGYEYEFWESEAVEVARQPVTVMKWTTIK